jgi:hypothetical protein
MPQPNMPQPTAQNPALAKTRIEALMSASTAWWQTTIFYQIDPHSFQERNQDGTSALAGISQWLDHIAGLHVGAIGLLPLSPPRLHGSGQSTVDASHQRVGSLEAFDLLLAGAHARGIKLLLDLSSSDGELPPPGLSDRIGSLHFWLVRGVDGFRLNLHEWLVKDSLPQATAPFGGQDGVGPQTGWAPHTELSAGGQLRTLPAHFQWIDAPWQASTVRAQVDRYCASQPPDSWPHWALRSHPQEPVRVGAGQERVAAMLLLTLPGTPLCCCGDEQGAGSSFFRALAALRQPSPPLTLGTYHSLDAGPENIYAYQRQHGDERILVVLNFADTTHRLNLSAAATEADILLSSGMQSTGKVRLRGLYIVGHEGLILRLRNR